MKYQIVADSSANLFAVPGVNYTTVPMKIIAGEKEYVDTPALDVHGMVDDLKKYKGKSGSSCPNVQDWLDAFGDAQWVFCITITKHLSGSYNSARQAAETYMEENPGSKVYVFDSLSTGPEIMMIVDKLKELLDQGLDFETIRDKVREYNNHNHTLFCLASMTNLARNGRVNPAVAKIAGMLGIRVVGDVKGGEITPVHKPRGEKKALRHLMEMLAERGLREGGLVRIAHCYAEDTANALKAMILEKYPASPVIIEKTSALCSFYAEAGGMIIGFEGNFNEYNDNRKF